MFVFIGRNIYFPDVKLNERFLNIICSFYVTVTILLISYLSLSPTYFEANYLLADTLYKLDRKQESLRQYESLVVEHKNNNELMQNYAVVLQDLGKIIHIIYMNLYILSVKKVGKNTAMLRINALGGRARRLLFIVCIFILVS